MPPPSTAPWRAVRLDVPPPERLTNAGYEWLRIDFEAQRLAERGVPLALYVPVLHRQLSIFVNGREVAAQRIPAFTRRVVCCAVYVELPEGAIVTPGANRLEIRTTSVVGRGAAWAPLYLGDASELWGRYEARTLIEGGGVLIPLLFAVVISAVCLVVWHRRRGEQLLLLFGLSAALYAFNASLERWFMADEWATLAGVAGVLADYASATLMLVFLLRYAGWRWPRVETALWGLVAASAAIYPFVNFYDWQSPWHVWWYTSIAIYMASLPLAAAVAWRQRDLRSALLVTGAAISVGLIGWQVFGQLFDTEGLYLWPYHQLGLFAVIAAMLIDRLVISLGQSERLNAELEQRVADKHSELEVQYGRTRELERERAVIAERARMMSDMHDGIGAQLISTLSLVEGGEVSKEGIATALRECVDDLRLAIDSLEPTDQDLLPVLGNLRYRLEPRLKAQGIQLDWQVQDVPKLACLTPENVLHVLRILQETFSNILKHAGAQRVRLATCANSQGVAIEVSDDGMGFDDSLVSHGYGIESMRRRARAVGATLTLKSSETGTTLSLLLPAGQPTLGV